MTDKYNKYAIIVAGGSGTRFGSTMPKQFLPLCDVPILMRTIAAFHDYDNAVKIIVALPTEYISLWNDLCHSHSFGIAHTIVEGGENRFESVRNALYSIKDSDGVVAVHDGARPLVCREVISKCFETAELCGSAVPAIPLTDSIRRLDRNGSHAVSRSSLVAVQTPQAFKIGMLKTAYATTYSPTFTDDASVVEFRGEHITLVDGDINNIKITYPIDIKLAEWILSEHDESSRD